MSESKRIRDFIVQNVEKHPESISRIVSEKFNISRQAVNRHLSKLVNEGFLSAKGKTRNKSYQLKPIIEKVFSLDIINYSDEDKVWRTYLSGLFDGLKNNVISICHYGFTEMYNNVIEHSEGKNAWVSFNYTLGRIELTVRDDGVGIFNKITKELGLSEKREAILELAKGKFTTDPKNHTGEGIFFTTRMFDLFSILSGELYFCHSIDGDWLIEDKKDEPFIGTGIRMHIGTETERTIQEVFNHYSGDEYDYNFKKTHVPVRLASYGGESLVSRSQAKRVLSRFDRFDEVLLDFSGVDFIGQAFADEIFRVYKNNNPNRKILWVNANNEVSKMIERARANV